MVTLYSFVPPGVIAMRISTVPDFVTWRTEIELWSRRKEG